MISDVSYKQLRWKVYEGADLEELMEGLSETEGVADLEMGVINGIPALSYTDTENDALNVAMMTDKGYAIVFSFSPMSEEGSPETASIMVASIQTVEE